MKCTAFRITDNNMNVLETQLNQPRPEIDLSIALPLEFTKKRTRGGVNPILAGCFWKCLDVFWFISDHLRSAGQRYAGTKTERMPMGQQLPKQSGEVMARRSCFQTTKALKPFAPGSARAASDSLGFRVASDAPCMVGLPTKLGHSMGKC